MEEPDLTPEAYCNLKQLPSHETLFSLLNDAINVLENEINDYRPKDSKGKPGSLLELDPKKNIIVVPDIHARPYFINNILNFNIPPKYKVSSRSMSVQNALEKGKINIVCVGDAFHTEKTRKRWEVISEEFYNGQTQGPKMIQEMTECLASFCALLSLKIKYPDNFHFLKGNHENILNISQNGDFAFCKYADEGSMVKQFICDRYGDDILYLISCYENLLPLAATGKYCVISHAEPAMVLTKKDLINARQNPDIVYSLIWTKNDSVTIPTVVPIIKNLLDSQDAQKALYFGGHRPVPEDYLLRQDGKYIQIHNPSKQNIAIVSCRRKFNPEKDIYGVEQ